MNHYPLQILVVGSLKDIPAHADICSKFVTRLGEVIVERDHTLLTGCRGTLDKVIAKSAYNRLRELKKDAHCHLIGYRLKNTEPVYRHGNVLISKRKDWKLDHPKLEPPEQFEHAHVAIFVAGHKGTFIAANWARIVNIPVLGVAEFGGAGAALYEKEYKYLKKKYGSLISKKEYMLLSRDTENVNSLAEDVISLAEKILIPRNVFPIMAFTSQYQDIISIYKEVCRELGFEVKGTAESETMERIIPGILKGIKRSAFVIADVSDVRPNVYYEIGLAQGLGKKIILTAKKGIILPFDIVDMPVIFWDNLESLKEQLQERLKEVVTRLR